VPENVINTIAPLHLFAQFWYHTRHIGKMGFLEKILVTPSHHRVHHAVNPEYMDKNLSQIFIVWDKLFGTFQEERPDVPPVYGISRPARTWNPIKINFQHLWLMIRDAWHTRSWKDKLTLWFRPTGYRPEDVKEKYPVYKIEDVYHFEKYDTPHPPAFHAWAWCQLVMILLLISYLFGNIASINSLDSAYIYWYGGFVFLTIYSLTELMDRHPFAWVWETFRGALGAWLLYDQGDWFGLSRLLPEGATIIGIYLVLSWMVTFYFTRQQRHGMKPAAAH
jgi:hypothetical protein